MRSRADRASLSLKGPLFGRFLVYVMDHAFLSEQKRHDEEDGDDGGDHASYNNASEGLLGLGSDTVGERGGEEA